MQRPWEERKVTKDNAKDMDNDGSAGNMDILDVNAKRISNERAKVNSSKTYRQ